MLKYISTVHSLSFFREVTNQFGMGKGLKLMNFSLSPFFYFIVFCAKYNNYKFICTPEFQTAI